MLNQTIQITQEQFMHVHNVNTIPSLIILYLINIFTFLIIGLKFVKHDRKKYFTIWIYSTIIGALGLGFLIIFPNTLQAIINYLGGLAH